MIKRRRNSFVTAITWLFICLLCIGLFVSVRRKRKIQWTVPDFRCPSPNHRPNNINNETTPPRSLTIVLWTPYYDDPEWLAVFHAIKNPLVSASRGTCVFTVNREPASNADALVFHAHDLNFFEDLPTDRCPWQPWIFFSLDAPVNSLDASRWEMANLLKFNLAMTYSQKADIVYPLGKVTTSDINMDVVNRKVEQFVHTFINRRRNAVWFTGDNCITASGRENLVAKLIYRGVEVDVIGNCPNSTQSSLVAEEMLTSYRFYFAFEDSYCDDYLKESFKALAMNFKYGIIPVVYSGASNLQESLPPGSYIDASSLQNVDQVADFLKRLSSSQDNQNIIASFYAWQRNYKIVEENSHKYGLQALCDKLWATYNAKLPLPSYSVDNDLRAKLGNCYQPGSPNVVQHFFF